MAIYLKPHTETMKMKEECTMTAIGPIPHLKYNGILCPVKLDMNHGRGIKKAGAWYPKPIIRDGKYAYALPGGGEIVA